MPRAVEIDEAELLAKNQVVGLVDLISKDPKARKMFHQAVKAVKPDIVIPEVDAANEVLSEISKEREAREALEKRLADRDAKDEADRRTAAFAASWNAQKDKLRDEGWMDDGLAEVEKLAQERGIVDLEAAASLHQKLHPPAEIVSPNGGFGAFDLFQPTGEEDANMKRLMETKGDDDIAIRSMVNQALTEGRSGGRRRVA